jgi:cysteine desulfurase/selenocysteine lyase
MTPPGGATARAARPIPVFDVGRVRRDFPILDRQVHGRPLAYLDNAATSQKPRAVVDALARYYLSDNANVHRGVHALSERATALYEGARVTAQRFLNAADPREIVFVRGATEAINLVAQAYARPLLCPGDEILVSILEHHSNFVPWKMACEAAGATLRVAPVSDQGELPLDQYERMLTPRTRLVAVGHVSNAIGTVNPAAEIVRLAHERGIPVLLDGAQAVAHLSVDVQALDCDFYAFSGHKVFGPTGIGVLYGRAALMERMPPWQGGGDMISSVTLDEIRYAGLPAKFEAGTPDIAGAVGLAAALDYLGGLDREGAAAHEAALTRYAEQRLSDLGDVTVFGPPGRRAGILSFVMASAHPHDIGTVLDGEGVAIRTGHHCCQPLMRRLGVPATARASLAFYNTREEIDRLVDALARVRELFG